MATFLVGRAIAVDGLQETVRGLKQMDKRMVSEVRKTLKNRTNEILVPEARKQWASQPIKPSVADSIVQPAAGQSWAGIRIRYREETYPYGAGVVWGSFKFRQFRPWKGNQYTGNTDWDDYIVRPAVERKGDKFADGLMDDLEAAIWRAVQ